MNKWKARIKDSMSDLPRFVLAWAVIIMAFLGGAFAAETFIGNTIEKVLEAFPWEWIPAALLFFLSVGLFLDLVWDALPERVAIWSAFAIPSVATAVPGKLGDNVSGWANDLQDWLDGGFITWFGDQPEFGLTVICLIGVIVGAKYALPKTASMGRM